MTEIAGRDILRLEHVEANVMPHALSGVKSENGFMLSRQWILRVWSFSPAQTLLSCCAALIGDSTAVSTHDRAQYNEGPVNLSAALTRPSEEAPHLGCVPCCSDYQVVEASATHDGLQACRCRAYPHCQTMVSHPVDGDTLSCDGSGHELMPLCEKVTRRISSRKSQSFRLRVPDNMYGMLSTLTNGTSSHYNATTSELSMPSIACSQTLHTRLCATMTVLLAPVVPNTHPHAHPSRPQPLAMTPRTHTPGIEAQ